MPCDDIVALRDKAVLALMLYNMPRVGAVVKMQALDFDDTGEGWIVLHEKRGKTRRIEAHHQVRQALRAYMQAAGIEPGSRVPLFQSVPRTARKLSGQALHRNNVTALVKRRCAAVGLAISISSHLFRTTGATLFIENGGDLCTLQELLGHAEVRTTLIYVRAIAHGRRQEVERVHL